ncbi:MAG: DinB family protein [Thermomicrobiales bacterium]
MDLLDFLLDQHAHSHAAALTNAPEPMLSDQILAGLTDARLRARPAPGLNSIAWLLWHLARCEDVMVGVLLTNHGQLLDEDDWFARLNTTYRDMGTGMDDAGVTAVSAQLDLAALLAYRLAVGTRTRELLPTLPAPTWDDPIDPTRLLIAHAFPNPTDGQHRVATYWQNRTRRYLLTTSITTHNYQHLGEANAIKSLVKRIETVSQPG